MIVTKSDATDTSLWAVNSLGNVEHGLSPLGVDCQRTILENGDGWDAYLFAKRIPGADISALQQVVLERGTCGDAYYFSLDVEGADINALQQMILDQRDELYARNFAKSVKGADIQALQKVVLERGTGWDVYRFACDVGGADLSALHQRLVDMHEQDMDADCLSLFNRNTDIQHQLAMRTHSGVNDQNNNQQRPR